MYETGSDTNLVSWQWMVLLTKPSQERLMESARTRAATGRESSPDMPGACQKGGHMNIAESILIITGASSGIGAATARELARGGATVVLAARRAEELNRIANDITHLGHNALAVPTDVGSRQSIDHLVAQTVQAYGRVDGVVNVAGIGRAGIIAHASDDVLEQMVMINLLAPARLIQAALPFMKHAETTAIVHISPIPRELSTKGLLSTHDL